LAAEKKKLAAELFYSRKRFFLFVKELLAILRKKSWRLNFSIRERDFFYS